MKRAFCLCAAAALLVWLCEAAAGADQKAWDVEPWMSGLQLMSQMPWKFACQQGGLEVDWLRCVTAKLLVLPSITAITLVRAHLGIFQLRCIQGWAHRALPQVGCSRSHVVFDKQHALVVLCWQLACLQVAAVDQCSRIQLIVNDHLVCRVKVAVQQLRRFDHSINLPLALELSPCSTSCRCSSRCTLTPASVPRP